MPNSNIRQLFCDRATPPSGIERSRGEPLRVDARRGFIAGVGQACSLLKVALGELRRGRRTPLVVQTEVADCAAAALAMTGAVHGGGLSLVDAKRFVPGRARRSRRACEAVADESVWVGAIPKNPSAAGIILAGVDMDSALRWPPDVFGTADPLSLCAAVATTALPNIPASGTNDGREAFPRWRRPVIYGSGRRVIDSPVLTAAQRDR